METHYVQLGAVLGMVVLAGKLFWDAWRGE
jgi:hypothetical protein